MEAEFVNSDNDRKIKEILELCIPCDYVLKANDKKEKKTSLYLRWPDVSTFVCIPNGLSPPTLIAHTSDLIPAITYQQTYPELKRDDIACFHVLYMNKYNVDPDKNVSTISNQSNQRH